MPQAVQSDLKSDSVHKSLDESIGLITFECGYHLANQSGIDILNDICCEYIKKIAVLLRVAHDTEDWRDSDSDFVDNLERVFHQTYVSSTANLHQFICKMAAIKKHRLQQSQSDKSTFTIEANKT